MNLNDGYKKIENRKKLLILLIFCVFLIVAGCKEGNLYDYGVFLGINENEADRLKMYQLVVIEPSEFSVEKIKQLHSDGKIIYGYLNIGSIEVYRLYYSRFEELFLDIYQDWPDENWIDVSSSLWQDFIVDDLARQYVALGLDGLFLDNADVYYNYPQEEIYQGLCSILKGLKKYDVTLIVNGGDLFVSRCIEENTALLLFDGINQETVFTCIDFENGSFGLQTEEETSYFKKYLKKAKENGLSVYLLEYGANRKLAKEIEQYCSDSGFSWYNAEDLDLR